MWQKQFCKIAGYSEDSCRKRKHDYYSPDEFNLGHNAHINVRYAAILRFVNKTVMTRFVWSFALRV